MKIDKYKKLKNSKYELIMENGEGIQLYEDTILKYNLLLTKSIDINNKDLINFDKKCEIYYTALKNIKTRLKSKRSENTQTKEQHWKNGDKHPCFSLKRKCK